jgi:hypothetical protein
MADRQLWRLSASFSLSNVGTFTSQNHPPMMLHPIEDERVSVSCQEPGYQDSSSRIKSVGARDG